MPEESSNFEESASLDLKLVLENAQEAYLKQDYSQSYELYSSLVDEFPDNPYLLINAGNSSYQMKNYGDSIAYFYQAKRIIPRNKDLNNNLELVLNQVELSQPPLLSFNYLTCFEFFILLLVVNLVFLFRKRIFKSTSRRFISAFVFVLGLLSFAYISYEQKIQDFAVIKKVSVQAYSGDDTAYSKIFELLDGQIIEVILEEDNWSKIKVNDLRGWVKNESLRAI